jgi:hypothetical protein
VRRIEEQWGPLAIEVYPEVGTEARRRPGTNRRADAGVATLEARDNRSVDPDRVGDRRLAQPSAEPKFAKLFREPP